MLAEFLGVKDTRTNFTAAVFDTSVMIGKDIENLMNWQSILLKVSVNEKIQVVVINNTDKNHNISCPQSLPQNMSGHEEFASYPLEETPPFHKRVVDVDDSTVTFMHVIVLLVILVANKMIVIGCKQDNCMSSAARRCRANCK